MTTIEQVEKLRAYADVSYEQARDALERAGGNTLDAIVLLEREGKIPGARSSADGAVTVIPATQQKRERRESQKSGGDAANEFFTKLGEICLDLWHMRLVAVNGGGVTILTIPVVAVVVLTIFFFWVTVPLLLVGLCCGLRYSFEGPERSKAANGVADKVNRAADYTERQFREQYKREREREKSEKHESGGGPERL
jgi:hypothetical protein